MPAILDDPASPTIFRVSGEPPYPDPTTPALPADILPRQVTLRDRQTVATIVPFASRHQIPADLHAYLCDQLNKEIEGGDTYPMMDPFAVDAFTKYWFQNFGAVMLLGDIAGPEEVVEGKDWAKECLGSFYIKPNYPGRSSHVCNAGFLVTNASRGRGVGRLLGESYIDWAPRLGYTYSVFNLVYETNVASCKIWDALGFKRIGRVKGCGNLKSYPDQLIDAIIYGRDLAPGESEELVSEERFDKIKFYLKYAKYPNGSDRAEKSRLRSAATHYKLLDDDKLMLKDKEVISDPARQYEIARAVHVMQHGGINKTTATIAEKYHWSRIKETVSDVIRNCIECKELGKTPNPGGARKTTTSAPVVVAATDGAAASQEQSTDMDTSAGRVLALQGHGIMPTLSQTNSNPTPSAYANPSDISVMAPSHTLGSQTEHHHHHNAHHHGLHDVHARHQAPHHNPMLQDQPSHHETGVYQPIDPQIINQTPGGHDNPFEHYHAHADFQALLNATEDDDEEDHVVAAARHESDAAVDRDLEMLIEHDDDDDDRKDDTARMDGLQGDMGKSGQKDRSIMWDV